MKVFLYTKKGGGTIIERLGFLTPSQSLFVQSINKFYTTYCPLTLTEGKLLSCNGDSFHTKEFTHSYLSYLSFHLYKQIMVTGSVSHPSDLIETISSKDGDPNNEMLFLLPCC